MSSYDCSNGCDYSPVVPFPQPKPSFTHYLLAGPHALDVFLLIAVLLAFSLVVAFSLVWRRHA